MTQTPELLGVTAINRRMSEAEFYASLALQARTGRELDQARDAVFRLRAKTRHIEKRARKLARWFGPLSRRLGRAQARLAKEAHGHE